MFSYDDVTTNRKFARGMLNLLFSRQEWINRRVDSLSFPDGLTVERSVNIDLKVPKDAPSVDMDGSTAFFIPVATIRKTPTIGFTMRDGSDCVLPLLPRPVIRDLSVTMVEVWAELCCGYTPLPESSLGKSIRYIVERAFRPGDLGHAKREGKWNGRVEKEVEQLISRVEWCQFHHIDREAFAAFQILVKMLARDYLVIAVLAEDGGRQRVLKYRYDRPLRLYPQHLTPGDWPSPRRDNRRASMNLPQLLEFPAGAAAYSRSYHFQVFVPEEVSIEQAEMWRYRLGAQGQQADAKVEPDLIFPTQDRDKFDPALIRQAATRVDLHPSSVELRVIAGQSPSDAWENLGSSLTIPPGTLARARFHIGPSRNTWLGASAFISVLSALAVGYVSRNVIIGNPPEGDYFPVAAFTAVILPAILRPEHGLAKFVLKPARAAIFVAAVPPSMLVALIDLKAKNLIPYWMVAIVSLLSALYLFTIWYKVRPSRRGKVSNYGKRRVQSETPLTPRALRLHEQSGWTDDVQKWIMSEVHSDDRQSSSCVAICVCTRTVRVVPYA